MAYGPAAPTPLPPTAAEQRRQIGDYIKAAPGAEQTGQAYVNQTNTSILSAINPSKPDSPQPVAQDDQPQNSVAANTQRAATVAGNLSVASAIIPQPNILDKFASNTWSASVYLLSPKQYTALVRSKKKQVNGYNLLFQSGGAPVNVGGYQGALAPGYSPKDVGEGANQGVAAGIPVGGAPDAGRNPAFTQDFYIDSITFDNKLPGKQTGGAHSVS